MTDVYREARKPLVERATEIKDELSEHIASERALAEQLIRAHEDQERAPGTSGYPLADEIGRIVGSQSVASIQSIERLARQMAIEETWSNEDAQRKLSQFQASRVEVEAIPPRSWTRFVAGLGSSIVLSASALLAAQEARIWPKLPAFDDVTFYIGPALIYLLGGIVLIIALYYWSLDDAERRRRYEKDFVEIPKLQRTWWGWNTAEPHGEPVLTPAPPPSPATQPQEKR